MDLPTLVVTSMQIKALMGLLATPLGAIAKRFLIVDHVTGTKLKLTSSGVGIFIVVNLYEVRSNGIGVNILHSLKMYLVKALGL